MLTLLIHFVALAICLVVATGLMVVRLRNSEEQTSELPIRSPHAFRGPPRHLATPLFADHSCLMR